MIKWFDESNGVVAILDATNSSKKRRRWVYEKCEAHNIRTIYVESKCDDEALVMANILEVKTTSPDYEGQDPEVAAQDFRNRIRNYEKVYQTIDEDEKDLTYVKLINVGRQVIINAIQDYLQSRVVYYLMNLHIKPRSIWLSRVSTHLLTPSRIQKADVIPPARRIMLQPRRQNRRRRRHLRTRRSLRARAARPRRPIRAGRLQTHHLDLDAQTHHPNGPLPGPIIPRLRQTGVESARRTRLGRLRRSHLPGNRRPVPGRLPRPRRRQIQLPLPRRGKLPRRRDSVGAYHYGIGAQRECHYRDASGGAKMHLRVLYECAAGTESVDGGAVAYAHQVDAQGVPYAGGEVQGQYRGC